MTEPTSAPWRVEIIKGSYQRPALVMAGDNVVVAQCVGDQLNPSATSIGEATANAFLIAAVHDLRAVARLAVELGAEFITSDELLQKASAALALADQP